MFKNNHINLAHGRPGNYDKLLKKIDQDGVCPFCPKNLKLYHKKPLIKETSGWFLTTNQIPYAGLKHHWLFISKKHITTLSKLTPKDWSELGGLIKFLEKKYKIPGGSFFIRFGETDYTGASVSHLHGHLAVGGKRKTGEEVNVRLAYKK